MTATYIIAIRSYEYVKTNVHQHRVLGESRCDSIRKPNASTTCWNGRFPDTSILCFATTTAYIIQLPNFRLIRTQNVIKKYTYVNYNIRKWNLYVAYQKVILLQDFEF
jgi:hypothetical protein